jgi:Ca2+-transporting ATPase
MYTEIGRIAGIARQVKEPRTPLQIMMDELSKVLIWFALGFSVLVPLVGIFFAHQPPKQMLLTGLSLAFATIPEELPIIITMVLSLGAFRLSKKGAIAKRLNAVESLGSVTVIATDKTGTLTENRMEVACFEPEGLKTACWKSACFATTRSRTAGIRRRPGGRGALRQPRRPGWTSKPSAVLARSSMNLPLTTRASACRPFP